MQPPPPGFAEYSPFATSPIGRRPVAEAPATDDSFATETSWPSASSSLLMGNHQRVPRSSSASPPLRHREVEFVDEASSAQNASRDDASVDSQGSAGLSKGPRTYSMLAERVADIGYRPYSRPGEALWTPLERPESAPLPIENRQREASNLALLVSSLQELTTVVARQGEEIRELKEENRALAIRENRLHEACAAVNNAGRNDAEKLSEALRRLEGRLATIDRRLHRVESDHPSATGSGGGGSGSAQQHHRTSRRQHHSPPPRTGGDGDVGSSAGYAWPPSQSSGSEAFAPSQRGNNQAAVNASEFADAFSSQQSSYLDPYGRLQTSGSSGSGQR